MKRSKKPTRIELAGSAFNGAQALAAAVQIARENGVSYDEFLKLVAITWDALDEQEKR